MINNIDKKNKISITFKKQNYRNIFLAIMAVAIFSSIITFNQVEGTSESDDNSVDGISTGDFDNDGYDDMDIANPKLLPYMTLTAPASSIVPIDSPGTPTGGDDLWHQDVDGISDLSELDDKFGWSLAAGDFHGDGYDDLAIGIPFEDITLFFIPPFVDAGKVLILPGSNSGITTVGDQYWD